MKTVGKQVLLSTIFGLLTLNVGTAESASASDIASRLKTTAREWMSALQKYKPQMTRQEKQRLITLTKRTSALIGAFLLAIGTAYQIFDDCVDLFGSEAVAGKSLGTDLAKGKLTLPILLLLERADEADRK